MRIAIASDHVGYGLKTDCVDLGIALRIQSGAFERGILICRTGVGASIEIEQIEERWASKAEALSRKGS